MCRLDAAAVRQHDHAEVLARKVDDERGERGPAAAVVYDRRAAVVVARDAKRIRNRRPVVQNATRPRSCHRRRPSDLQIIEVHQPLRHVVDGTIERARAERREIVGDVRVGAIGPAGIAERSVGDETRVIILKM